MNTTEILCVGGPLDGKEVQVADDRRHFTTPAFREGKIVGDYVYRVETFCAQTKNHHRRTVDIAVLNHMGSIDALHALMAHYLKPQNEETP